MLRLSDDDALLRFEPNLDRIWPRFDADGNLLRDWDVQHALAADFIERRLRNHRDTADRFELGRVGQRSREVLRDCAACLALHFIYVAADTMGDQTGFFARKADHYKRLGHDILEAEQTQLDYDSDRSGEIDQTEQDQPFPPRFIRG